MRPRHPEEVDVGDVQCPFVTPNDDGTLNCFLRMGHVAPHQDAYGHRHGYWYQRVSRLSKAVADPVVRFWWRPASIDFVGPGVYVRGIGYVGVVRATSTGRAPHIAWLICGRSGSWPREKIQGAR